MEGEPKLQQNLSAGEGARLERRGKVVNIYKPEGVYTIIYGKHDTVTEPTLVPTNAAGLVLETGESRWVADPWSVFEDLYTFKQYLELFKLAEQKRLPIYFADTRVESSVSGDVKLFEILTVAFETGIGALLIKDMIRRMKNEGKLSRRDLLLSGLASWLSLSGIPMFARRLSHDAKTGEDMAVLLQKLSRKLHPEIMPFSESAREVVMAEKNEWIQRQFNRGKEHQPLVTVVGAQHVGLETMTQEISEERLKFLRAIKPIIQLIFDPKTFYSVGRFDYDGKTWHASNISEVPSLKEIIDK